MYYIHYIYIYIYVIRDSYFEQYETETSDKSS